MKFKNFPAFFSLFWALIFLIGCEGRVSIPEWINRTEKLLLEVEKQSEVTPYRIEQFQAFKQYFKEINQLAVSFKENEKLARKLNKGLNKTDLSKVCGQIFLGYNDWKIIERNCMKNGFFLCSEEVRAYPDAVVALRKILSPDQKILFDQAESCKRSTGL